MHLLNQILDRSAGRNGGELRYFGLSEWWSATFSPAECERMEAAFRTPELPSGARPLTRHGGLVSFPTAAGLLAALGERLSGKAEDRNLACRVLAKAEERALAEGDILGLHLTYHHLIRLHTRWRRQYDDSVDLLFAACHKQMRLAPQVAQAFRQKYPCEPLPAHVGYLQAATVLEQQGAYAQAIELCREARTQGWAGNWSWRIQRLARRLPSTVKTISSSGMSRI